MDVLRFSPMLSAAQFGIEVYRLSERNDDVTLVMRTEGVKSFIHRASENINAGDVSY